MSEIKPSSAVPSETTNRPKAGERWRVTIEGEVIDFDPASPSGYPGAIALSCSARPERTWIVVGDGTWERLPDPEPEWEPGDLALDAEGQVWKRFQPNVRRDITYVWSETTDDQAWTPEDEPLRPLRRLVVESSEDDRRSSRQGTDLRSEPQ